MKRILFSPIGNTDPIKDTFDGALLHIIRKYSPDEVYLYASKRIVMNEAADHRYSKSLDWLMEELGYSFDYYWIERNELTEVQVFDTFFDDFKKELNKIYDKDAEIYLNVSSGTPAMKSALQVLASLYPSPLKPIQVADPDGITKHRDIVVDDYDVEYEWELNQDNEEDYRDRCSVSQVINQTNEIRKNMIKELVDSYDYVAALRLVEPISGYLNPDAVSLIHAAVARLQLDKPECQKNAKDYDIYPKKSGDEWRIFEYLMLLDVKLKKKEYADFIRAISPLFFEILQRIAVNILSDEYSYYTYEDKYRSYSIKWKSKACDTNKTLFGPLKITVDRDRFVTTADLDKLIELRSENDRLKKLTHKLRLVEEKVRNYAAHTIMGVTEDEIRNRSKPNCDDEIIFDKKEANGFSSADIFNMLKDLIKESGIRISVEDMKTYDKMNEEIRRRLG